MHLELLTCAWFVQETNKDTANCVVTLQGLKIRRLKGLRFKPRNISGHTTEKVKSYNTILKSFGSIPLCIIYN
jgi:hypothetical protein